MLTILRSPPRSQSPHKSPDGSQVVTPPSSPSKSKLQSPSKQPRIPSSPHRPSIDAFWSADVINDWNEQFSPERTLKSLHLSKPFRVVEDEDEHLTLKSPRSQTKSPVKRDRRKVEQRKLFDERKHDQAISFINEVDMTISNGQVSALAESTGGIKLIWSKKLSSTAGRANWRRETVRLKDAEGTTSMTTERHHASIELAEKVIDCESRKRAS